MLALAFSGGKDSLACWYLYRNQNPVVIWVNTGKCYPETIALIDEIRRESNKFVEVNTDQQGHIEANGFPSDVVPIDWTGLGHVISGDKPVKVQSYLECCADNISRPLMRAAKELGVSQLIRGQRIDDSHKSPARHGTVIDGIEFIQPIENWTEKQVFDFVKSQRGSLPDHYKIEHTSLDCYDCTAYVEHSADRVAWMKKAYPAYYEKYAANMCALKSVLMPMLKNLERYDV